MNKHRLSLTIGTLAWALLSVIFGVLYCFQRTTHPGAEGYETDWKFQAFMFLYSYGVVLLLVLGALLGVLHELFRKR